MAMLKLLKNYRILKPNKVIGWNVLAGIRTNMNPWTHLNFTGGCDLPQVGVVGEGDVVGGVPVEAVAVHVEGHRVQHVVDGGDHLRVAKSRG